MNGENPWAPAKTSGPMNFAAGPPYLWSGLYRDQIQSHQLRSHVYVADNVRLTNVCIIIIIIIIWL